MSLTNKEIFERHSNPQWFRKVYVKRLLSSPSVGSDIVTNGNFYTDSDWTKGTGWSIASGVAKKTAGTLDSLSQDLSLVVGKKYRVEFSVYGYATGNITPKIGSAGIGIAVAADGSYSQDLLCAGDSVLYLEGSATFAGSVYGVSVKELIEYEDDWQDITKYCFDKTISSVSRSLPNDKYSFGKLVMPNANLEFINISGEMSDEDNKNSIFNGTYIRHNSLIRITCGYFDKYTEPDYPEEIEETIFEGLLDDKSAVTTENNTEKMLAKDYISLLESLTLADIGALTSTTVNTLVYEIMARGQFMKFFQVLTENISAGYNTSAIDTSVWDEGKTVIDMLSDLAFGHSIFYVDSGIFYFKVAEPTPVKQSEFTTAPERKIKIYDYKSGSQNVIEKLYWKDSTESFTSTTSTRYGTSMIVDIDCVTDTTQRQNLLDYIGALTETKSISFKIDLPFCPFINVLDAVKVERFGYAPDDAFILGIGRLGIDRLRLAVGAIKISYDDDFYVKEVKHDREKTTILVEWIYVEDSLLTESGLYLLTEAGDKILLEN